MHTAIEDLFDRYEKHTNAALAGSPNMDAILDMYDAAFIGSSPIGVMAGTNDKDFEKALAAGFERNRQIGARRMEIENLRIEQVDAMHALAHIDWRAIYDSKASSKIIAFSNAYLVRIENGQARIFGWITGDENAVLRRHGII